MKCTVQLRPFTSFLLSALLLFSAACSDEQQIENENADRPLTKMEIQQERIRAGFDENKMNQNAEISEFSDLSDPVIVDTGELIEDTTAIPEDVNFISFNLLKQAQLNMKKMPPKYPEKLSELNTKEVTIIGFMQPIDQVKDIKHCLLVSQPQECYYCKTPVTLLDLVYVKLKKTQTMSILEEAVKVTGTLKLVYGTTHLGKRKAGFENRMVYCLLDSTIVNATPAEIRQYLAMAKTHRYPKGVKPHTFSPKPVKP